MVVRVAHGPHSSSKFTNCEAFPVSQGPVSTEQSKEPSSLRDLFRGENEMQVPQRAQHQVWAKWSFVVV